MSETAQDPLKESIQQVASLINLEAVQSAPQSNDPMLRLLQQEVARGSSVEDALSNTIERIAAVGGQALEFLGFPPSASTSFQIDESLKAGGASDLEISAAMSHLLSTSKVGEINGWYFKKPEPRIKVEDLSGDDIDWLMGTGRYAQ